MMNRVTLSAFVEELSSLMKLAEKREKKQPYVMRALLTLPALGANALVDMPAGAVENFVEKKLLGASARAAHAATGVVPMWRKALGQGTGYAGAALSAPIFYDGFKDATSKDEKTRRRGLLKLTLSGATNSIVGGLAEGATEGGLSKGIKRAKFKYFAGLPALAGAYYSARKIGRGETNTKDQLITGALVGAAVGGIKGAAEAAYEGKSLFKTDPKTFRKLLLARAGGRIASGAVKGIAGAYIIKKMTE